MKNSLMNTRPRLLALVLATLGVTALVTRAEAKKPAAAAPSATAAPARAFQTDFLGLFDDVQKKILSLEDAVPADKFKWRPAAGVRSIAEAYLHIAFGNYGITRAASGKEPPADAGWQMDRTKWDTKTTDKAEIKKVLEKSFEHVRTVMKDVQDADLDKKVSFFGHEMTERAAFMVLLGHLNEHMGQEVAYARANGVVPPWSMAKGG
jgi:uncharacterized damage-inducible protein DinB